MAKTAKKKESSKAKKANIGGRRVTQDKLDQIADLAKKGHSIAFIARTVGVSRNAVTNECERRSIAATIKKSPISPKMRAKGVRLISREMASGIWDPRRCLDLARVWGYPPSEVRQWAISAAARVNAKISMSQLSAYFIDTLQHLKDLADICEEHGNYEAAIGATSRLGQLIIGVSRTALEGELKRIGPGDVSASSPAEQLIALGWTPPVPKGLPAISSDDNTLDALGHEVIEQKVGTYVVEEDPGKKG